MGNDIGILTRIRIFLNEKRVIVLPLAVCFLIALPLIVRSQYLMRIVVMIGIYSILAMSLNLVTGYTGQVSLGHAAFYAIGAYASALLSTRLGLSFFASAPLAAIIAGVFGLLLGLPTLRLSGSYLSIATMGFCEVVRMVLLNWESLTNGALGIQGIPKPEIFGLQLSLANRGIYYLMLVLVAITAYCIHAIVRSSAGRALTAIRDDELAATMMGVRTTRYKVLAFVVSAIFSGLAGAFYAHLISYIDPNSFTFDTSIVILSIVIMGGMGTMTGPFLGALILISFPEVLRFVKEYRFVVYGLILVVMMRFKPQGFLGGQQRTPYGLPKGLLRPDTAKGA